MAETVNIYIIHICKLIWNQLTDERQLEQSVDETESKHFPDETTQIAVYHLLLGL